MEIQKRPFLKIKESLGRGKAYILKGENIKGIFYVCESMKMFLKENLFGQEKTEVENLIAEAIQLIKNLPAIQPYLPSNFSYDKGKIKKLYLDLVSVLKKIIEDAQDGTKKEDLSVKELEKRKILDKLQRFLSEKDMMGAIKVAEKFFEKFGKNLNSLLEVADEFYASKNYKEAINFAKKILERDPKNQKAYKIILNSYMNLKEYEKVEEYYIRALKEFGEHANIFFNLYRLYCEWGKKDKAYEALKRAVELEPENESFKKAWEKLTQGRGGAS